MEHVVPNLQEQYVELQWPFAVIYSVLMVYVGKLQDG
jgi:hypothetical protein